MTRKTRRKSNLQHPPVITPLVRTSKLMLFNRQRKDLTEKVRMKGQKIPYQMKHQLVQMTPPGQNTSIYCPPAPKNTTPVVIQIMMND